MGVVVFRSFSNQGTSGQNSDKLQGRIRTRDVSAPIAIGRISILLFLGENTMQNQVQMASRIRQCADNLFKIPVVSNPAGIQGRGTAMHVNINGGEGDIIFNPPTQDLNLTDDDVAVAYGVQLYQYGGDMRTMRLWNSAKNLTDLWLEQVGKGFPATMDGLTEITGIIGD